MGVGLAVRRLVDDMAGMYPELQLTCLKFWQTLMSAICITGGGSFGHSVVNTLAVGSLRHRHEFVTRLGW